MRTRGGAGSAAMNRRVPSTRLSRMRRFASGVQRCATGSPARWITASQISSGCGERRLTGCTVWPPAARGTGSGRPMNPVGPVRVVVTLHSELVALFAHAFDDARADGAGFFERQSVVGRGNRQAEGNALHAFGNGWARIAAQELDGIERVAGQGRDPILQVSHQFADGGNYREVEGAGRVAPYGAVALVAMLKVQRELEVDIQDGSAAGQERWVQFEQAAHRAILPDHLGGARGMFEHARFGGAQLGSRHEALGDALQLEEVRFAVLA